MYRRSGRLELFSFNKDKLTITIPNTNTNSLPSQSNTSLPYVNIGFQADLELGR